MARAADVTRRRLAGEGHRARRFVSAIAVAGLAAISIVAVGVGGSSAASQDCDFADGGTGLFSRAICWFDLTAFRPAQAATAAGQAMTVSLPDGSTMSFTLNVTGSGLKPVAMGSDPNAFLGNNDRYTGVAGLPVLTQKTTGTTSSATISNISVVDAQGNPTTHFALLGADAGSTDAGEAMIWSSDTPLNLLTQTAAGPGIGNACNAGLTGIGTTNVTCTAIKSGPKTGTALLGADNPSTFAMRMVGGQESIAFGVLVARVQLSATLVNPFAGDAVRVDVTGASGANAGSATTDATGTAMTGKAVVLAGTTPSNVTLSQTAVAGSLSDYTDAWTCTRKGLPDPSLPSGDAGSSVTVAVSAADLVTCSITDTAIPASLALTASAAAPVDVNGDGLTDSGDTIAYAFTVTNTGPVSLSNVGVTDRSGGSVTCLATTLAPSDTTTCATDSPYVVTAADVTAGTVHNVATATGSLAGGTTISSAPVSTDTPTTAPAPSLALTKLATINDVNGDFQIDLGDTVSWAFKVTNSGNVPLSSVSIADNLAGSVTCPATSLAPGAQTTCSATVSHTITQADVDAGVVENTATAQAIDPDGHPVVSPSSTTDTPVQHRAAVSGVLRGVVTDANNDGSTDAGDTIAYTMTVHNSGQVTLNSVSVTSTAGSFACPGTPLAPGDDAGCIAPTPYTITAADVAAGRVTNTATAHAVDPFGTTVSAPQSTLNTPVG
jgi:uncharacterized repeat protein (TIGR01451 family)